MKNQVLICKINVLQLTLLILLEQYLLLGNKSIVTVTAKYVLNYENNCFLSL